jgi:pyrimidine-nucleoside phosphorylase
MRAVDIIRKKRDGQLLAPAEIEAFVAGAVSHAWPDYQVSALLMAIVLRGMDEDETAALTRAMVYSGTRLDWSDLPGAKVDKHSSGGVGDKTSLILVPLAAACGALVPKTSGRGLGHTGGTLDKLESIPGFRVRLSLDEMRAALRQVGCFLVGQTADVAPADRVLYALRDVTATVESIPLIAASIMSKKLAEGLDALVLDVKCGRGAFMKGLAEARQLAERMKSIGAAHGVRTEVLLTAMDEPLGRAVGHSLEVAECVQTLRGNGPADLEGLAVQLAARLVRLAGQAGSLAEAEVKVRDALRSGRGLEKLKQLVEQQGGDPRVIDNPSRLPSAPGRELIRADRAGYFHGWDAEQVGRALVLLGAGRNRVEDSIDHSVGAVVLARRGQGVEAGDPLLELHYRDEARLSAARALLRGAFAISDERPTLQTGRAGAGPVVLDVLE